MVIKIISKEITTLSMKTKNFFQTKNINHSKKSATRKLFILENYMNKEIKLYFNKIVESGVWKWVYYLAVFFILLLIASVFFEIVSALTQTNQQRIANGSIPIPAECCWEFHSKTNAVIYFSSLSAIDILFLFFSYKTKNYLAKIFVAIFPVIIMGFYTQFFVNL
ncbi:MAG: hypothetical protein ACJAS6_000561 [Rickettsiales bacterium]|jgi:hypothetical protein